MPARILVIGSSNTDLVAKISRLPRPGETVIGGEFLRAAGGKGANQAVAAARAGAEVTLVARVGDDDFGRAAVAGFQREGICTDHIVVDRRRPSGVALIFVDARGENCIAVASGANAALSSADVDRARPAIERAQVVVLQLEIPLRTVTHAIKLAKSFGKTVLLNPAPALKLPRALLRQVDYLTPNEHELRVIAGGGKPSLKALGCRYLIETRGAAGSRAIGPGFEAHIPAFKVRPVDTVGAGDCFSGTLAVAIAEKMWLTDAIRFASAAAAICVTRAGAQPSMPSRREIEAMMRRT